MFKKILIFISAALFSFPAIGGDLTDLLPESGQMEPLKQIGQARIYTPDNLWEKINGEAELFKRYNFKKALSAAFRHPADAERRVEIMIFTTNSPMDAFGLFASFRPTQSTIENIGNGGVIGDYQAFFWHGRHFIMADSLGPADTRPRDLRASVEKIASRLGKLPPRPQIISAFETIVDPFTIRYQPGHLLGREAFPQGLEGVADNGLSVFLATVPSSTEKVLSSYRKTLDGHEMVEWNGTTVLKGSDPALGPMTVAARGNNLAGVRSISNESGFRVLIDRLLRTAAIENSDPH